MIDYTDLKRTNQSLQTNPFDRYMGHKIIGLDEGESVLMLEATGDTHSNSRGDVHKGVLYGMADSAMGVACATVGKKVVTLELSMNYFMPTTIDSRILAKGHVVHSGGKTLVCTCDFFDEKNRCLGAAKGTFFVIGTVPIDDPRFIRS